jgi:hypothetical protein
VQVTVIPIDLARWDQSRPGDLVCVPIWSDVRPLRGAAGLLDWRMCGRLSSWMVAGKVTGADGEQTLFPSANRLAWRLILAVGVGARADFSDKRLRAVLRRTMKTMKGLGLGRVAMALPGREDDGGAAISARRALDMALHEVEAHPGLIQELTVIEPPAAQKEVTEALRLRDRIKS